VKNEKVLIVDDERNVHYSFQRVLGNTYEVVSAFSGEEALQRVTDESIQLVLMDVRMPGRDGVDTLQELKRLRPQLPVIIMTAFATAETAIRATTLGAEDYLVKPLNVDSLKRLIADTLQRRELPSAEAESPIWTLNTGGVPILGHSRAMQEVYKIVGKSAARDVTVLITGESGTGKELIARALHAYSRREKGPFVAINCAAIPETLLESELFGHERGAFSGATEARPGKFELAHEGVLFLDEIGDMPIVPQSKLLRVLQEHEIYRLGAREPQWVDVRIIAASNQDLETLMRSGRFREDLYYRLNVISIELPSLRERKSDIPILVQHFLHKYGEENAKPDLELAAGALDLMMEYDWPGNVRELENAMERAFILETSNELSPQHLPESVAANPGMRVVTNFPDEGINLECYVESLQKGFLEEALRRTNGVQVKAAELLHMSYRSFRHYMQKYNIAS